MTIKGRALPGLSFHFFGDSVYNSKDGSADTCQVSLRGLLWSNHRNLNLYLRAIFALAEITISSLSKPGISPRAVPEKRAGLRESRLSCHLAIQTDSGTGCMGEDSLTVAQEIVCEKKLLQ